MVDVVEEPVDIVILLVVDVMEEVVEELSDEELSDEEPVAEEL
jgi:precorrin-4 methylase